MPKTFYIKIRGKPFGPFDERQVREMIVNGNLVRESEISENCLRWDTVGDYDCFSLDVLQNTDVQNSVPNAASHSNQAKTSIEDIAPQQPQWYFSIDGKTSVGPYPESTIATLIRAGQISPQTIVWQKGETPDTVAQTDAFAACLPQPKSRKRPQKTVGNPKRNKPQPVDNGLHVSNNLTKPMTDSIIWLFVLVLAVALVTIFCVCLYFGAAIISLGRWMTELPAFKTNASLILFCVGAMPVATLVHFAIAFLKYYNHACKFSRVPSEHHLNLALRHLYKTWRAAVMLLAALLVYGVAAIIVPRNEVIPTSSLPRSDISLEEKIGE